MSLSIFNNDGIVWLRTAVAFHFSFNASDDSLLLLLSSLLSFILFTDR